MFTEPNSFSSIIIKYLWFIIVTGKYLNVPPCYIDFYSFADSRLLYLLG